MEALQPPQVEALVCPPPPMYAHRWRPLQPPQVEALCLCTLPPPKKKNPTNPASIPDYYEFADNLIKLRDCELHTVISDVSQVLTCTSPVLLGDIPEVKVPVTSLDMESDQAPAAEGQADPTGATTEHWGMQSPCKLSSQAKHEDTGQLMQKPQGKRCCNANIHVQ